MNKQGHETDLGELEAYFKEAVLPDTVQLNAGERVTNTSFFVNANLTIARTPGNGLAKRKAIERLEVLREVLSRERGIRRR